MQEIGWLTIWVFMCDSTEIEGFATALNSFTCLQQQYLFFSYTLSTFNKYKLDTAEVCQHQFSSFRKFQSGKA